MSEVFDLDRDQNIKNNVDATGKKWIIVKDRTNHLLYARPEGGRADSVIPEKMAGAWTKQVLLQEQIKMHVQRSWDKADAAAEKQRRRQEAAKEQERRNAQEAEALEGSEAVSEVVADAVEEPESTEVNASTKEEEVVNSFESMPYDQLLLLAKEQGITARKKTEIIEALTDGTKDD